MRTCHENRILRATAALVLTVITGCGDATEDAPPPDGAISTVSQSLLASCGPWPTVSVEPSRWWLLRSGAWIEDSMFALFPSVRDSDVQAFSFRSRENHRTLRIGFRSTHPEASPREVYVRIPAYGITIALDLPNTWPANTFGYWTIDPVQYGVPFDAGVFWYTIEFRTWYVNGFYVREYVCNRQPSCTGTLMWQAVTAPLLAEEADTRRLLTVSPAGNGTYVAWDHDAYGALPDALDIARWWVTGGSPPPVAVRVEPVRTDVRPLLVSGSYFPGTGPVYEDGSVLLNGPLTATRARVRDPSVNVLPSTVHTASEVWFSREGATSTSPGWDVEIRREWLDGFVSFAVSRLDCRL